MNYCDENGCVDRNRHLVAPKDLIAEQKDINVTQSQDVFPDEITLARQLIEIRDNLVKGDVTEAYHVLCQIADPDLSELNHWAKLEALINSPNPSGS
jgi:hypothetical protein